jgi:hypothetical protein
MEYTKKLLIGDLKDIQDQIVMLQNEISDVKRWYEQGYVDFVQQM